VSETDARLCLWDAIHRLTVGDNALDSRLVDEAIARIGDYRAAVGARLLGQHEDASRRTSQAPPEHKRGQDLLDSLRAARRASGAQSARKRA
jgi:hypothetical protein